MPTIVDLSHPIRHGMITYPGLPAPVISDHLGREESRGRYAPGHEFQIGRIDMVANTGTYLDTPFHRFADGHDLAGLDLDKVVNVTGVLVAAPAEGPVGPDCFTGRNLTGKAVLIHTGWAAHFGSDRYGDPAHPGLTTEATDTLVAAAPALVGIDSVNIDLTVDGERPAHTGLLRAGIPIVEHLTGLDRLGEADFTFSAVPPPIAGMGSFPVRAYAVVD